jgi:hypothetical protein
LFRNARLLQIHLLCALATSNTPAFDEHWLYFHGGNIMADINVERRRPSMWPWLIGLLALAALIYGASQMLGKDRDRVDTRTRIETTQ